MNPYGDGSDGVLNVTSGTANLQLNRKYQFTDVTIASGATLSTNSTTGAVLYICATGTVTINGSINLVGKVNPGQYSWSTTIDGITFTSPSTANGGAGGAYVNQTIAPQGQGFGGGGGAVSFAAAAGGNGGAGGPNSGSGGQSRSLTVGTNQDIGQTGYSGGTSAGGAGGVKASWIRSSGNLTGNTFSGNSGAGGSAYGQNGANATAGSTWYTGGTGGWIAEYSAGGGGGAGGVAGRAGVHVYIVANTIIINGSIITSGTNGGNGGSGGYAFHNGSQLSARGAGGGGGGGGNAGNVTLKYGKSITQNGTISSNGGIGGSPGNIASSGGTGVSGFSSSSRVAPIAMFSASPVTGARPLSVSFTNSSIGGETYTWNFGDSSGSSEESPTHVYDSVGTYTVTLTTTNPAGSNTMTRTAYITTTVNVVNKEAKGTLKLGGFANRKAVAYREAKGGLILGGRATAFIRKDTNALEEKRYLYKIYDENGNYIETWRDVIDEPQFSQEINQLGSTMTVQLARNADSLGQTTSPLQTEDGQTILTEDGQTILATTTSRNQVGPGSSVQHNYRVDVYVFYGEVAPLLTESGEEILTEDGETILAVTGAPNGRRIFTGFISDINIRYGDTETTTVTLSSYGFDTNQYVVTDGDGKTTVAYNSWAPSDIAEDLVDKFVAQSSGESYLTYTHRDATSISSTVAPVSYTFQNNTYGEALQKVLELMPSDWYFYVGLGDNLVYFRQRSVTPQHVFYLGKHIKSLDLRSYTADSVNSVYFTGGGDPALFKRYEAPTPEGVRRGLNQYSDSRVTLESSADIISEGLIDEKNKVQYRSTIEILTKQYDIESIDVGDTVGFRNFGNNVDTLVLQVVARTYTPDVVTLQLDSMTPSVNKRLEDIRRALTVADNQNIPDQPTI